MKRESPIPLHIATPADVQKKRQAKKRGKRVGLLNPEFRYVPASKTNVAKTFARIRREMKGKS